MIASEKVKLIFLAVLLVGMWVCIVALIAQVGHLQTQVQTLQEACTAKPRSHR